MVRLLTSADAATLEAFLASHRDSSMFLRANARRAGLEDHGELYQARYAAAFRDGVIIGAAAHCWNGTVLLQAPEQAAGVARACVAASGRKVTALAGPSDQVREAMAALALGNAAAAVEGDEDLYALDLEALIVPVALSHGTIVCRAPRGEERDTLSAWRMAYDIETLNATDSPEQRTRSAAFLDAQISEGNVWVALDGGALVSLAAFNATLPDIVQLGGIYTPPQYRGRGFAKAAVAAALLVARERGASRAVLFTRNRNAARSYEAVGFRRVGEYSLVLLR